MKKIIIIGTFFLAVLLGKAQPTQILSCKGDIPKEILTMSSHKVQKDIEKIKKDKNRKVKKNFYLITNYTVDELLKSGRILFGDELSNYVNEVAQEVLKNDQDLLAKLKFYVVKSSEVNAFSTQQGIIFINVGLLAQLENEAQLAYVIAHEAIHYKYNHMINQYVNKQDLIKGKGKYGGLSGDKRENLFYNRSKDDEFSADKLGLTEIFLKTNYSIEEAANLFDILLYSSLPFDEIEFDTTFFDTPEYKLSSENILNKIAPITTAENYNDDNHTHPNIKKRRESFIETTLEYKNDGRVSFIVSKDRFMTMRNKCRMETLGLYINNDDYAKALYSAYLLKTKDSTNDYINYALNYSLYAASKAKTYNSSSDVFKKYKDKEGKSQQVYYMFSTIKKDELCLIAANKIWKHSKKGIYASYNKRMVESLIYDLILKYKFSGSEIISINTAIADTSFKKLSKDEYDALSKYEKIKYDKKLKVFDAKTSKQKNTNLLLNELFRDPDFASLFKEVDKQFSHTNIKTEENEENIEVENSEAPKEKKNSKEEIKESIKSVCVVNPQYECYNYGNIDLIESEKNKVELFQLISKSSSMNNVDVSFMDSYNFKYDDVEKYNNLSMISFWTSEVGGQIDNGLYDEDSNHVGMMPFSQPLMDEYIAKSKVENLMFSYVYSYIDQKDYIGSKLFLTLILTPFLPYGIYNAFTPQFSTEMSNICINAKSGSIITSKKIEVNYRNYKSLLNSQFYDYFNHLKTGKY